ncbi:methyltransferase domain-containing protein [Mycolicibacterium sp. S2-37]|uniref:class I SAM-dependent methyltransferase n=1 Tax=Mycolicibacterium sp. S2-37 TaxID=2810297 RepID=UPI001A93F3C0|nr:methyltransferase domain-containing protein [Mycolicibacterium sp. S2-37]MBO0677227.1 methyltransferase domain-containing protein [Mycolicibacterium sp. S2-37]
MVSLRENLITPLARTVAGQLGRPHGPLGGVVAEALDRGNGQAIATAVSAAQPPAGGVAADIGFGGGAGLRLLVDTVGTGGTAHGVEISDDMLRRARRRFRRDLDSNRLKLHRGSLTALPFDDAALDAAITVNTIYFVDDLDAVCAEFARTLRPGGRVAIGIGDPDTMRQLPVTPHGFRLRPVDDIVAALQRTGLTTDVLSRAEGRLPRHTITAQRDG